MDVLTIQNLKKNFGSKEVLCGLDLSVPEHSIFGFIGKNGAGKTTTMKAILGLLKADSGEIHVMGEKVHFGQTKQAHRLSARCARILFLHDTVGISNALRRSLRDGQN